jgi:hypothetical protein
VPAVFEAAIPRPFAALAETLPALAAAGTPVSATPEEWAAFTEALEPATLPTALPPAWPASFPAAPAAAMLIGAPTNNIPLMARTENTVFIFFLLCEKWGIQKFCVGFNGSTADRYGSAFAHDHFDRLSCNESAIPTLVLTTY